MESTIESQAGTPREKSNRSVLAGNILIGILAAFMLMDVAMHVAMPAPVVQSFVQLGMPLSLGIVMAGVALVATLLYVIPRTSILGAILLTAYLGGATACQLRISGPYWFSIVFGILVWAAVYLRDDRVRALIPLRK